MVVLSSNDAIGTLTFGMLYVSYYFYCFSVANLSFATTPNKGRIQSACMDGVYTELRSIFAASYPAMDIPF